VLVEVVRANGLEVAYERVGEGPVLVHVVTQKGKGYEPAELAADKFHGVVRFDVVTGHQAKSTPKAPQYTGVFAHALMQEAEGLPSVVISSAAAGNAVMMGGGYFTPLTGYMNVADAMGCAVGTVKSQVAQGIKRLRKQMGADVTLLPTNELVVR